MTTPASGGAPDVPLLAASLRASAADLDVYADILTSSLADTFPPGSVAVAHDRSLGDRLAGRPGRVSSASVTLGDRAFEVARTATGAPLTRVITSSGGIVISRRELPAAQWAQQLAEQLAVAARESEEGAAAIARLLGL